MRTTIYESNVNDTEFFNKWEGLEGDTANEYSLWNYLLEHIYGELSLATNQHPNSEDQKNQKENELAIDRLFLLLDRQLTEELGVTFNDSANTLASRFFTEIYTNALNEIRVYKNKLFNDKSILTAVNKKINEINLENSLDEKLKLIISTITEFEYSVFSLFLTDKVAKFKRQLEIFSMSNLITLMTDYMKMYWKHSVEEDISAKKELNKKHFEKVLYQFFLTLMDERINPLREICGMHIQDDKDHETDIKSNGNSSKNKEEKIKYNLFQSKCDLVLAELNRLEEEDKKKITEQKKKDTSNTSPTTTISNTPPIEYIIPGNLSSSTIQKKEEKTEVTHPSNTSPTTTEINTPPIEYLVHENLNSSTNQKKEETPEVTDTSRRTTTNNKPSIEKVIPRGELPKMYTSNISPTYPIQPASKYGVENAMHPVIMGINSYKTYKQRNHGFFSRLFMDTRRGQRRAEIYENFIKHSQKIQNQTDAMKSLVENIIIYSLLASYDGPTLKSHVVQALLNKGTRANNKEVKACRLQYKSNIVAAANQMNISPSKLDQYVKELVKYANSDPDIISTKLIDNLFTFLNNLNINDKPNNHSIPKKNRKLGKR